MLLSLIVHTYSLRYCIPAAVMLGTAPVYLLSWGAWRLLSTVLPARLYHTVDDHIYTVYQSMVLFFFENYTGVEVSLLTLFFQKHQYILPTLLTSPAASAAFFFFLNKNFADTKTKVISGQSFGLQGLHDISLIVLPILMKITTR